MKIKKKLPIYKEALRLFNSINITDIRKAKIKFESITGYKDSDKYLRKCASKISKWNEKTLKIVALTNEYYKKYPHMRDADNIRGKYEELIKAYARTDVRPIVIICCVAVVFAVVGVLELMKLSADLAFLGIGTLFISACIFVIGMVFVPGVVKSLKNEKNRNEIKKEMENYRKKIQEIENTPSLESFKKDAISKL